MEKIPKNEYTEILKDIIDEVFQCDVMSKSRRRYNVDGRRAFSIILKNRGYTFTRISKFLKKDHATIIHYLKNVEGILKTDPIFRERFYDSDQQFFRPL